MPTAANAIQQATTTVSLAEVEKEFAKGLSIQDQPPMPCRRTYKPRIVEDRDKYTRVHGTSHTHVSRSLRDLHNALGQTPSDSSTTSRRPVDKPQPYPRVEKWVDYATKHGIAYLLTDGSLGIVLKSKEEENKSSGCVVIRNAKRHTELRTRGREHQFVPQASGSSDVEFYEQIDPVEPMRRLDVPPFELELDLDNNSSAISAAAAKAATLRGAELSRWKEITLLDKFGKYMHKQMGSSDTSSSVSSSSDSVGHLIHFYQRLGNGHSSLSEAEIMVDVIYLEPRDAKDMAAYGLVTHEALERRDLKTFRLVDVQQPVSLRRSETEIIRANEVQEKLNWIRAVIGCWIKEGCLGWTGEERLGWGGLQERREDKKMKLQWVTVGRPGGDAERDVPVVQK
ncbi:Cell cycle serine/threonine-protein kinase cdc5/MSD2 [Elasticomyces elasticus]|nr:Cell cycle serine/threonine-protein kinase cdc5/MSD2 [Elasticomyces elasticus]